MRYIEIPGSFCGFVTECDIELGLQGPVDDMKPFVERILGNDSHPTRHELLKFLDVILNENISDAKLEYAWRACGSRWRFSPEQYREIFGYARDYLEKILNQPG